MKLLCVVVFVLSFVIIAPAQTTQTVAQTQTASQVPADLTVLKFSWSEGAQAADLTGDIFAPFEERDRNVHDQVAADQAEADIRRARRAGTIVPSRDSIPNRPASPTAAPLPKFPKETAPQFVYHLKVKNNGTKTIKAVSWDYVFIDPDTQKELARHHFHSAAKIKPAQSKSIAEATPSAPTKIVTVRGLNSKDRHPFEERIVIKRLEYTDGSVWERPMPTP